MARPAALAPRCQSPVGRLEPGPHATVSQDLRGIRASRPALQRRAALVSIGSAHDWPAGSGYLGPTRQRRGTGRGRGAGGRRAGSSGRGGNGRADRPVGGPRGGGERPPTTWPRWRGVRLPCSPPPAFVHGSESSAQVQGSIRLFVQWGLSACQVL